MLKLEANGKTDDQLIPTREINSEHQRQDVLHASIRHLRCMYLVAIINPQFTERQVSPEGFFSSG